MMDSPIDQQKISTILFDIGGVLVHLRGLPFKREWLAGNSREQDVLPLWHHSTAVHDFESGRIAKEEFAARFIAENNLQVSQDEFLDHLFYWPYELFSGVPAMLARLGKRFRLAALSNSNELHWPRLMQDLRLGEMIPDAISSHQINIMKPDRQAFIRVIDQLGLEPAETLFLDDLQASIEAARATGLQAVKVVGTRGGVETAKRIGL